MLMIYYTKMERKVYKMETIILASKSPRRKEILEMLDWDFEVCSQETEEIFDEEKSIEENMQRIAMQKAKAVIEGHENSLILACDTTKLNYILRGEQVKVDIIIKTLDGLDMSSKFLEPPEKKIEENKENEENINNEENLENEENQENKENEENLQKEKIIKIVNKLSEKEILIIKVLICIILNFLIIILV